VRERENKKVNEERVKRGREQQETKRDTKSGIEKEMKKLSEIERIRK
jgi:hypothetical protein